MSDTLTINDNDSPLRARICESSQQLALGEVSDEERHAPFPENLSVQRRSLPRKRGRKRKARSMGRYPWDECVKAFQASVRVYYSETTRRNMERALRVVGQAFTELKAECVATTTNPKKFVTGDIEAFLEWMRVRPTEHGLGLGPTTQANYILYLRNLLRWVGNPVIEQMRALHYVKFPRKVPSQVTVLPEARVEELRARLKDMPGWKGHVSRFLVAVYAYSGLRRSELRRAGLGDIDTSRWTIDVVHPKGENRWASAGASVILLPAREAVTEFLEARRAYLDQHGVKEHEALVPYVFKDGPVDYFTDGMWGKVKDSAQAWAGIRFKMQQLRASFGQMCKDRGASIESVSRCLRHRTTRTTELYYARIRPDDAFRELESLFEQPDKARW